MFSEACAGHGSSRGLKLAFGVEMGVGAGCGGATGGAVGARMGIGAAGHHHGELFQGALLRSGDLVPCLITLPARGGGSRARYVWKAGTHGLEVVPAWKSKAERAAALALEFVGAPREGRLEIECSVTTGVGLGSSTCDVVAAIRAVCSAHDVELDSSQVARLAIEAEGAADPIMFGGEVVLFAQRQGRVLESYGCWVPRYTVLSIDTDPGSGGIDTLSLPLRDYTRAELETFEGMVERARVAFRRRDSGAIAGIATQSAALNQRFLPLRGFREIRELADELHAFGVQISHSGTVAGILFDGGAIQANGDWVAQTAARVCKLGMRVLGVFTTGEAGAERD
jgi:uncharacterized protein involved in propanediol utilization